MPGIAYARTERQFVQARGFSPPPPTTGWFREVTPSKKLPLLQLLEERHEGAPRGGVHRGVVDTAVIDRARKLCRLPSGVSTERAGMAFGDV